MLNKKLEEFIKQGYVKIRNIKWRIDLVEIEVDDNSEISYINAADTTIYIKRDVSRELMCMCLMHEILHCIFWMNGLTSVDFEHLNEETIVQTFSTSLFEVLE